jgi:hypothetical protein
MTLGPIDDDPSATRLAYLPRESNVKSVGQLCYLVAFFGALGTLEFFLFARGVITQPPELKGLAEPRLIQILFWALTIAFLLVTLAHLAIGYGLTHLQSWARWTVVVITGLSLASGTAMSLVACLTRPVAGLLSLVIGGAINGLILYPLLTPGSGVVFSAEYKEVIRRTPTIESRMHWLLKLLIGLILAGVLGFLAFLLAIYLRFID